MSYSHTVGQGSPGTILNSKSSFNANLLREFQHTGSIVDQYNKLTFNMIKKIGGYLNTTKIVVVITTNPTLDKVE